MSGKKRKQYAYLKKREMLPRYTVEVSMMGRSGQGAATALGAADLSVRGTRRNQRQKTREAGDVTRGRQRSRSAQGSRIYAGRKDNNQEGSGGKSDERSEELPITPFRVCFHWLSFTS